MICETVKAGRECVFMTKKGCSFNGGSCHPIVEQCNGCEKMMEYEGGIYCMLYPDPAAKWAYGRCSSATHVQQDIKSVTQKVNPLKASKRKSKGK
ncbi:MAG TPA: hypothetical protein ENN35_08365 [Deltaproteobacteria bacterium]|nr:hypothetical protein [Deltaproteobacteria bacterium]